MFDYSPSFKRNKISRMELSDMRLVRGAVILVPALMLAVLAGCMGGKWGGGFSMPPAMVETAVATVQPVEDRLETVGTLEADKAVTIVAEISGVVKSIPFSEGSYVSGGSLIAKLDDSELKADLDRASALRDQMRGNYNRVKTIVDQGAGAQQDLDDASAALKVAEANVAAAQARFDKTEITAPFDGTVGARRISPGAYLRPGDAIVDLARVQELRVIFSAPERYLSQLKRGSAVSVYTTAFPGYTLKGTIEVIEPQVDQSTRNVTIVARVPNPEGKFRPGMSANVAAVLNRRSDALTISSEAVVIDQNQPVVYVVKPDCTVTRTVVQLGARTNDLVEVVAGLEDGQRVVRAGHQKIFDGAKVIPISSADTLAAVAGGKDKMPGKDTKKTAQ
jgi:membrane fusion protein (multidrug efflux system)